MTQQIINLGPQPNDGQGDDLRTAFDKTNENFTQIWTAGPVGLGIGATQIQNTITLGSTVTPPVTGTRTVQRIESQVVGDGIWLTYKLGYVGGSAGTGDYLLSLPTGITFNATYNPAFANANPWLGDVHNLAPYHIPCLGGIVCPGNWTNQLMVDPYDSTRFRIVATNNVSGSGYAFWNAGYYSANTNTSLNIQFEIWK